MWASVRVYGRRYVATVVAIVVGVGFVVVTNVLSSAARNGLLADVATQYAGSGTVVSDIPDLTSAERVLRRAPGPAAANATLYQPLALDHRSVTDEGRVGSVSTEPALRWQRLTTGAFPTGVGQALVDAQAAQENGVRIGSRVTVGRGQERRTVTVTGLVRSTSGALAAPLYLTWPDLKAYPEAIVSDVVVASSDVSAVRAAEPGRLSVETTTSYVQGLQAEASRGVDGIAVLLLLFAAISFFVSAMVIANTFSILLAQRARDFALLRCVGATRKQVRRSVLAESLVVGATASTLGVLAGLALGTGLVALAAQLFPALPAGEVGVSTLWVGGAWLLGVGVTVVSSLLPAWRGTRVSPLAALRPDGQVDVRSAAGRWRLVAAAVAIAGGALLLAQSISSHSAPLMLAGGTVNFLGVLLLGPVLVPACVRLLGLGLGRFGVPGRIAAANAVRNPRRTAATAASLLVGVTLISGLVTGMATIRSTVDTGLDQEYPLDLTLTASHGSLGAGVLPRVRDIEGVQSAQALPGADAAVLHGRARFAALPLLGVDRAGAAVLRAPAAFATPGPDVLYLPWGTLADGGLSDGDRVQVRIGTQLRTMTARGTEGIEDVGVVSVATLHRLSEHSRPRAVWVRATDAADPADVRSALSSIGWSSGADVQGGLESRAWINKQLDVMTAAVVAMLGIGVVIALVGIGNTLGLSVLERTREHSVLRALGLTRRQLQAMLASEAVLLATVAGLLGVALGAVYAWVGVEAVVGPAIEDVSMVLPVGQLVLLVVTAAGAGLAACLLPARRASRIAPAAGLTSD